MPAVFNPECTGAGIMLWHGVSDARRSHAPPKGLSPLLRQAMTHPGAIGTLGRGTAVMPGAHASQLGRPTALMHLASDAVRAAATSPFLEGTQGKGGMVTVLCTLALPPPSPHLSGTHPLLLAWLGNPL